EFNVFSNSNLESNNFKRNSSIEKSLPATTLGKEKLLSNSFLETIQGSNSFLDLSTILKSTQAISSEILLGNLLEKMITIAIENAGAQRGVLLLEKEENFYIEADGKVDGTKEILQSISMDNEKLPITILNYVIRTTQSIVIADGLKDNRFNKDIFITKNQVRSILCMPIIGQGKINGILYLENNLVTNAFTTDRLELLKVLASQASISIENARLYNSLEQKVEERTKELNIALAVVHDQKIQVESTLEELKETQEQLIHAEKFAALGQLVAGVAHEINNPIGAIQASAERIEDELEFGKREFPEYFRNLQEHEIPIFNELLDRSLSNKVILTTKEERNRKKIIKQSLESLEFSSSDKRSLALEYLSNLGITDRLDNYFTVLKEDKFLRTINIVDRFVSQNKSLRNIYISVEKASKVVFALRKFLNTNIKTEKKTISIREELEKVIKVYDNYINGFIEVSFEIREDVKLTCLADEMSQVWRNIIFNSIQAMYSTEKNLKITLECERDSDNSEKKMAIVKIS
ncbi:GAF domain-containing protein, partial [bacterium]|nr:GAF domain-containing protein [Candidatus Elulimicrobium humile]